MVRTLLTRSVWARTVVGIFFCVSGAFVTSVLSIGAPSFWYFLCGVLWTLSGLVWIFRPSIAPALSLVPVLALAVFALRIVMHILQEGAIDRLLCLAVFLMLGLIVICFQWGARQHRLALAISLGLVLIAFVVDRHWMHRISVVEYSMNWTVDGVTPWGRVEVDETGQPPVVVFRRVNDGYCYDAIFSIELSQKLRASNKPTTSVQYNIFSDFGRQRSYNVRAIDGLIFNDGDRVVRAAQEGYGGYVETSSAAREVCGR
jgi:hypothetical protein